MAFDSQTRNKLQRMVGACRRLLADEFDDQLQGLYGIYAQDGRVLELEKLTSLDDDHHQTATLLRDRINHLTSGMASEKQPLPEAVRRVLREQAFTVLNRFAALRMAEERGFVQECVGQGLKSKGFQVFETVARSGLGGAYERYVTFIHGMFDELSLDLGVLFDRWSPFGLLFPREPALLKFFDLLNDPELKPLWREDETIGWVYQYFNDEAERKRMREESSAPRNSRELAVRNQFFTPRYVVEFLTDNTLGRIWYEMTRGETKLKEQCRYLVRRPNEIFLKPGENPPATTTPSAASRSPSPPSEGGEGRGEVGSSPPCSSRGNEAQTSSSKGDQSLLTSAATNSTSAASRSPSPPSEGGEGRGEVGRPSTLNSQPSTAPTQEELLKQPVFIPHRPLKDPRTIRILDPACGSMHFGLYAFDLLETIYEEAWDNHPELLEDLRAQLSPPSPPSEGGAGRGEVGPASLSTLNSQPSTPAAARRAFLALIPRLIIEHNLHGIDIDPRATQIAGLALWLRAQKAWQRLGLKPAERPAVKRSNIVCAEPMPGEKELLREFVEREFPAEERGVCLRLLEAIFDKMQLAGEAGSLLKIEEEIHSAIEDARRQWQTARQRPEFFDADQLATLDRRAGAQQELPAAERASMAADFRSLTSEVFWERIEERIYAALRDYAEQAENGGGFQRRLFAEDAARGFAFIDVCRKRYDVALMNPPFGSFTIALAGLAKTVFGRLANDIYACFVRRMGDILAEGGAVGIISSRSFVTGKGMEALRPHLLGEGGTWLKLLWDFGVGVLDGAMVETAAYVYCRCAREPAAPIGFWNDKLADKATLQFPSSLRFSEKSYSFFRSLPAQQFIYEADDEVRNGLNSDRRFEPHLGRVTKGLSTCSNERFVRCLWEIPQRELKSRWEFLSKGGEYRWLSCDLHLALNWGGDGRELAVFSDINNGNPARARQSSAYYFKPAVCFSGRSQKGFSARWLPAGCIFDTKSPVVVPKDVSDLPWIAPLLMSSEYQRLISLQSKFGSYDTSAIARLPLPQEALTSFVGSLADIWSPHLNLERATETTWYFVQPLTETDSLKAQAFQSLVRIDELLQETGRSLDEKVRSYTEDSIEAHDCFSGGQGGLFSYGLGVAFGRWDIRYATGEQAAPELPDPFAPLPVCPPGQLQNAQGLPARPEDVPAAYPVRIPWDGILVDDPNHPLDIERRVREVIEIIWGSSRREEAQTSSSKGNQSLLTSAATKSKSAAKDSPSPPSEGGEGRGEVGSSPLSTLNPQPSTSPEAIEHEACEILGVKSLRDYFRRATSGFFADHLKRYSKSRRQAPIYWPLSTASGSYTLWVYYHRLTDQTLFQCVNDFVKPKLEEVNRDIERLRGELQRADGGNIQQREKQEELEDFAIELKEFLDELLRVAGLPYKPNLNDGVLITASPLWKLFRLPKWQKELKACWAALEGEEYEWAHLAYTLWPDRVKQVCKTDRSIAIAHGLEELCEVKAPAKKAKKARKPKDAPEAELEMES